MGKYPGLYKILYKLIIGFRWLRNSVGRGGGGRGGGRGGRGVQRRRRRRRRRTQSLFHSHIPYLFTHYRFHI
jgi:hypothetical protein